MTFTYLFIYWQYMPWQPIFCVHDISTYLQVVCGYRNVWIPINRHRTNRPINLYATKTCELYMGRGLNYLITNYFMLFYVAKKYELYMGERIKLLNKYCIFILCCQKMIIVCGEKLKLLNKYCLYFLCCQKILIVPGQRIKLLNKHCLFYVTKTCEMYMGRRLNYWIYIVCLFYAAKNMWLLKGKNVKLLNKYYELYLGSLNYWWLGLWWLTPLSIIFQLYGSFFFIGEGYRRTAESHKPNQVHLNMSGIQNHNFSCKLYNKYCMLPKIWSVQGEGDA